MLPTATATDLISLQIQGDDARPLFFVDPAHDPADDLGDWWNDLGCVDLPA